MATSPRVVVIGAGVVGCALADELTQRGWTDVTVVEQGAVAAPGGSSSHAPGLVFQTNGSRTMASLAAYTATKLGSLTAAGRPAYTAVGGLEVATTPERLAELHRRQGWNTAWGIESRVVDPGECARLHPLLDVGAVLGGLHVPSDGLADAPAACEAQLDRARARGARVLDRTRVTGITRTAGAGRARVTGVETDGGTVPAGVVVCCAGFWGAAVGAMVGLAVPLQPMAHQYARTGQVRSLAGSGDGLALPILRHQDADLYYRRHGDRMGIGYYGHRPMPVGTDDLASEESGPMPSMLPFTEDDFADAWTESRLLLPGLADTKVEDGFNGIFSFTPDGSPLLGEHAELSGFWLAEAVWVTHSAGVGRAVAEWIVDGTPGTDLHECDLHRFSGGQLSPAYVRARGCQSFVEVYDIIHPHDRVSDPVGLRTSPFHHRQVELGAVFGEASGWERPLWHEANAPLLERHGLTVPERDDWASRWWSPIAAAEAHATRNRVAMYDMTPLMRLEVSGPGALALLQRLCTNQIDKSVGSVTYSLLLDGTGGVRSDVTVARLGEQRFQVGVNGPLDLDWVQRHLPDDHSVVVRDVTGGTCCVGVWGPLARDLVQPLTSTDVSHTALKFFRARELYVGAVPVTALRVSYVGELGWELYASAEHGALLWDTLYRAGAPLGVVAGGRLAFNGLRLEKGYRAWGTDMTAEHDPYEAGLGFAVRPDKGDFVGRAAIKGRSEASATRRLTCLTLDDPGDVVLGREPVRLDGTPVGYVTSAGYGYTVGRCIAYAWLPSQVAAVGTALTIDWFGRRLPATVAAEPLVDPEMARIRR